MQISDLIIFQNHHFLVANKPVGMPVQSDPSGDMPLITLLEQYCKVTLLPINRIDRPVSGLVLLAKTKAAAADLNVQFSERTATKHYLAATKTAPPEAAAELIHFIRKGNGETNTSKAYGEQKPNTERAVLQYETVGQTAAYTLLKIRLITGRHHQIRAQLAAIGCPIKGDVKYGARRANPDRAIHLHAWQITLTNPMTRDRMTFEAPLPTGDTLWAAFDAIIHSNT
jgi:23S rRNA pseudouridine1911/1915/1917 synthase